MSYIYNESSGEYVSSSNGSAAPVTSYSSGGSSSAGYNGSYESYSVSSNAAAASSSDNSAGYAELNSTGSDTINQIANDLLQLNRGGAYISGGASGGASGGGSGGRGAAGSSYSYETGTVSGGSGIIASSSTVEGLSALEVAILRSTVPIDISETEEITVNGQRGIWANRAEVVNWRGEIPITQYSINEDPNPEVITKRSQQQVVYSQEVAIRYLRPPTPPAPGEIFIQQESNITAPPAPPLIIRQQPPRPVTPQPLVVREAPPQPPSAVGRKVITISGKRLPPPPRKVVIERLAPLPSKPQSVIIERWLPYSQVKRRVIFQKASGESSAVVKPKNVIIQWEAPQVMVKKEFKDLGVIRANPAEYVARYGSTLKTARELPSFVLEIKPPAGVVLAADYQYNSVFELEGDVQALRLIDLDREGLGEYRALLQRLSISSASSGVENNNSYASNAVSLNTASASGGLAVAGGITSVISEIFNSIDRDNNGRLSVEEAEKVLLRLNSRLGRRYGEDDVKFFFQRLDSNRDGAIDLAEFRQAFERSL